MFLVSAIQLNDSFVLECASGLVLLQGDNLDFVLLEVILDKILVLNLLGLVGNTVEVVCSSGADTAEQQPIFPFGTTSVGLKELTLEVPLFFTVVGLLFFMVFSVVAGFFFLLRVLFFLFFGIFVVFFG